MFDNSLRPQDLLLAKADTPQCQSIMHSKRRALCALAHSRFQFSRQDGVLGHAEQACVCDYRWEARKTVQINARSRSAELNAWCKTRVCSAIRSVSSAKIQTLVQSIVLSRGSGRAGNPHLLLGFKFFRPRRRRQRLFSLTPARGPAYS